MNMIDKLATRARRKLSADYEVDRCENYVAIRDIEGELTRIYDNQALDFYLSTIREASNK